MPTETLIEKPRINVLTWEKFPASFGDEALRIATQTLTTNEVIRDHVELIQAIDAELDALADRYSRNTFDPSSRLLGFVQTAVALLGRREAYLDRMKQYARIAGVEPAEVEPKPIAESVHALGLAARPEFGTDLRALANALLTGDTERLRHHLDRDHDNMVRKYERYCPRPIGESPWLDSALEELEPMIRFRQEHEAAIAAHSAAWSAMDDVQRELCRKAIEKAGGTDTVASQLRAVRRMLATFWRGSGRHVELENARRALQAVKDRVTAVGDDPGAKVLLDSLRGEQKLSEKRLADVEAACLSEISDNLKALVARVADGDAAAREELVRESSENPSAFAKGLGTDLAKSWGASLLPLVEYVVQHEGVSS